MIESMTIAFVLVFGVGATEAKLNLAPNPSFEVVDGGLGGYRPVGMVVAEEPSRLAIVEDVARSGSRSLRITPGPDWASAGTVHFASYNGGEGKHHAISRGGVRGVRTLALRLDRDVASVSASAWVKTEGEAEVTLGAVWTTRRRRRPVIEIHRDEIRAASATENGWRRFELAAIKPHDAHQVQILIETDSDAVLHVDDVHLVAHRRPGFEILVDQLGYETGSSAKGVILQSNDSLAAIPPTRVVDLATFRDVQRVTWADSGYLPTWDRYHYKADLSELRTPGRYVVAVGTGRHAVYSLPFEIGDDLVFDRTAELGYRFY